MREATKNISIGVLVCAALALAVWALLFLHPKVGDEGKLLRVRFTNIDKIAVGTHVTFAGRPVGEVISLKMVPNARENAHSKDGAIYTFELTLTLDSSVEVHDSDEIQVHMSGLMGERNIAIVPKRAKDGVSHLLQSNDLLYAASSGSMEETVSEVGSAVHKADQIMSALSDNQKDLQQAIQGINSTSKEMQKFLARANEVDLAGSLKTVISKADALMNDVNHYGMLFHLDKGWQRERRKRMEELAKLKSPKEIKQFLNLELSEIQMAISRLNMAMDKAAESPHTKKEFERAYKDLLAQVQSLEKSLENYNSIAESEEK